VRLYTPKDACDRLRERHGIKLSPVYLRKLRCLGTGPAFVLFNGRPHYTDETLDEYVQENTSAPAHSSAAHANAGNRRARSRRLDTAAGAPPALAAASE
jgi:hypothetical protein